MPASSALLTDIDAMIAAGPDATTQANANSGKSAAAYPSAGITDYQGMLNLAKLKLAELAELYTMLYNITDSGDGNYSTLADDILTLTS